MNCTYFFKILKPSNKISLIIDEYDDEGKLLYASQDGNRVDLNNKNLILSYLRHPLTVSYTHLTLPTKSIV